MSRVTSEGKIDEIPARVDAGMRKGLHTAGVRIASRAKGVFEMSRPKGIATGATVRSITVGRVRASGVTYRIRIGPGTHYAQFLHEKTPPQRPPPLKNIVEWLKAKPGTPPKDIIYAVARAVQRKISREGTKAFPFMATALRLEGPEVADIIKNAILREIKR